MWLALLLMAFGTGAARAEVVDRIAVVAGNHVIKTSEVDRDLRLTGFINGASLDLTPTARRAAADRLVNQTLIRQELTTQGYARATDEQASDLQQQIARQRFQGSTARLRAELARYGVTEDQLHQQLLWQLTVLRFIDQRFRPAVLVTDEEVRAYYDAHLQELQRQNPKNGAFEALSAKIRADMEGERIDKEFDAWIEQARKRTRIEFKEPAFQ